MKQHLRIAGCGLVLCLGAALPTVARPSARAHAQTRDQDQADTGERRDDMAAAAPSYAVQRPPPEPGRRGLLAVPEWVVWSAGGLVSAAATIALIRLAVGRRRRET